MLGLQPEIQMHIGKVLIGIIQQNSAVEGARSKDPQTPDCLNHIKTHSRQDSLLEEKLLLSHHQRSIIDIPTITCMLEFMAFSLLCWMSQSQGLSTRQPV